MNWLKKHKNKLGLLFILVLGAFITLVLYKQVPFFYEPPRVENFTPEKVINISEPFSGKIHFNNEVGSDYFSNLTVEAIDLASSTIEIAMYSMDDSFIKEAIYRAVDRGVKVNIVFSNKYVTSMEKFFERKSDNLKISFSSFGSSGYMHHKFMIVDRGLNSGKLFFGSSNFTYIQAQYDPSFIMETDRPELVNIFGEEFDRLLLELDRVAVRGENYNSFAALINYPEGFLEIWFLPSSGDNSLKNRLLNLIYRAENNVKAMIWHFTDKDTAINLVQKAKDIPVKVIIDDFNFKVKDSVMPFMSKQKRYQGLSNLELIDDANRNEAVRQHKGDDKFNSFLHHHLLITDDNTVVFGTNNWSSSGFFANNESVMISNISSLVSAFNQTFEFHYNLNK